MIPVLLVEDEELEMKNLRESIDYEELGLSVVGAAFNGEDALRLIEEKKPQIVITDIVMPRISGIEIARRIKSSGSGAKVVVITGHQRFDYAKLALECGVEDYLVKPVLPEHLKSLLERLSGECAQNNRRVYEERFFKAQLERNMPLLLDCFVGELLEGTPAGVGEIAERMDFYGIALRPGRIAALAVMPEIREGRKEYSRKLSHLSMRHSVEKYLRENGYDFCCAMSNDRLMALLNLPENTGRDGLYALCESLRRNVETDCGLLCTIGAGTVVSGYDRIPESASCAVQALEHRFFLGSGQVIAFDDISGIGIQPSLSLRRHPPRILDAVKAGNAEQVRQSLREISEAAANAQISSDYLRVFFIGLLSSAIASQYDAGEAYGSEKETEYYMSILSADTLESLVRWSEDILVSLCETRLCQVNSREKHLVSRITDIIRERYAEELHVEEVASHAAISAGYAAKLFKKLTGKNIGAFLTEVRMQHAAGMLKNPDSTIGDVANSVGYANIAYFSSVFRKTYNCTPREYRDSHAQPD